MIAKRFSKNRLIKAIFGCLFAIISIFSLALPTGVVYADPVDVEPVHVDLGTEEEVVEEKVEVKAPQETGVSCEDSLGEIGWWVCPQTGKIAQAVDWLYDKIEDILVINPVEAKDGSPIYEIWKYAQGITNIVFVIFLMVVIYSQLTGVGISNYGIKKILPKLIVVAILVNLSFNICSLAVDVSNIIGSGLRGVFTSIEESTLANFQITDDLNISLSGVYSLMAGAAAGGIAALGIGIETGAIWMLIPVVLGAIVAVVSGLITIALRQAVVTLLIMISPLAIVAYMLPNTEQWFKKWKQLFTKMLVFYPMFSLLFGASSLAGWAIIASATDGFGLLLGLAVQIFPLFFSWNLMKMSGTFLGTINSKIQGLAAKPLATNRAWAESHREATKQKYLASGNAYTPTLRLRQYLSNRKIAREEETRERAESVKNRGLAYSANRNYRRDGTPSREGEESYGIQARNMQYQRAILRHKNNMNKGLGQLEAVKQNGNIAQIARLNALDAANVQAADLLKVEQARAEKIDSDNAAGFYKRMDDAVNAHFDAEHVGQSTYKRHDIMNREAAEARYNAALGIMEGNNRNVQYAAATAAQMYDTQAKIISTKFQKYFELTPPTQDVMYRLQEFSKFAETNGDLFNKRAVDEIDTIISGLRIVNQRGDTDLVKSIVDDITNGKYGGLQLGTHASQALASFLMFEVKDNDPFLRRFGKYINLETARVYNSNDRKAMDVTYDEYIKGYHDEPDGTRMYAKKDMKKLVEGTSLDNIERTALANLDDSLKKAYGFDASEPNKQWDVSGWLRKREEIQTAFEPAFLSASLKWLSGSEQINSGVKFWTGYELKQKKDKNTGKIIVDENGDPEYDLAPVWEDKKAGFAGHEKDIEDYYRRKTMDYFKDQTTGQILGMRTDYRDPTMEHLVETYLSSDSSGERRRMYEESRSEIQTRYADKTPEEANKMRAKDLKKLKMDLAGKQLRKILGETGKLKQIYRTRTSGTAINAKDWLRGWVNLDDEDALRKEMSFYDEKREEERRKKRKEDEERRGVDTESDDVLGLGRVYGVEDRERFLTEMQELKDKTMDDETEVFFEETKGQLEEWFGPETLIVKKYEQYYRKDSPNADNIELYGFLKELLGDLNNYPDA